MFLFSDLMWDFSKGHREVKESSEWPWVLCCHFRFMLFNFNQIWWSVVRLTMSRPCKRDLKQWRLIRWTASFLMARPLARLQSLKCISMNDRSSTFHVQLVSLSRMLKYLFIHLNNVHAFIHFHLNKKLLAFQARDVIFFFQRNRRKDCLAQRTIS